METLKKILSSRIGLAIVMFIAGGAAATFLTPEKIVIKRDKEIVEVEKEVIREVEVEKKVFVEKVVEKTERVRVVKREEIFPDGHTIREEIFESESEQIDRIKQETEERYAEALSQKEAEFNERIEELKIHYNPKRFIVYAGIGTEIKDRSKEFALGGFSYTLWGPVTVGAQITTNTDVAATVGLRF